MKGVPMRKKTIKCLSDEMFWFLIYALPLLVLAFMSFKFGAMTSISDVMSNIGLDVISNNFVFTSLSEIFGSSGIVPMFSADIIHFMSYLVCVWILHIAVDVLLWLPRWFHSIMKGEE